MAFGRKKQQSSTEISREELTRTQVLNLQELESVAKYERQTSKRPAALFAFAGFFAITMGLLYPNIMTAVDNIGAASHTSYRVELNDIYDLNTTTPVATDKVTCTIAQPAQADGTDKTSTIELYFHEQKLQTYVKTMTVTPTAGNAAGVTTTTSLYNNYAVYDAMAINGYTVATTAEGATTKVAITIDLQTLDKTQLTYDHVANSFTNVEYELNADQTAIQTALTATGYTCTQQ